MSNRKCLLIETWLEPDPDDHITTHDLYVSSMQALEYIESLEAEVTRLLALLLRYRNETPLGHQPHMIASEVDAALAAAQEEP